MLYSKYHKDYYGNQEDKVEVTIEEKLEITIDDEEPVIIPINKPKVKRKSYYKRKTKVKNAD